MHISYLLLVVARVLFTYSSVCSAFPHFTAKVVPRSVPATDLSPNNPSLNDSPDPAEPTCTEPGALSTSFNDLGTFSSDCIAAADSFFSSPGSRIAWHWKRVAPRPPQPGYNFLPWSAVSRGCMIQLDVLDDLDAEDQFPLVQIAADFRRLFRKCVTPNPRALASGFVPVGPRKVMKLSIAPSPMSGSLEEGDLILNAPSLLNSTSQR